MEFYNEALSHTWTINPTTVNTVSVFWDAHVGPQRLGREDSSGQNMCWSRYINVNELPGQCYMEGFSVGNGGFNGGWTEPSQEVRTTYGLYDNFSKTLGEGCSFGGYELAAPIRRGEHPVSDDPHRGLQRTVHRQWNSPYRPAGYMQSYTQGAGEIAVVSGWQYGFYGQDQFRVRSDLTITAGLRWDPEHCSCRSWWPGRRIRTWPAEHAFPELATRPRVSGRQGNQRRPDAEQSGSLRATAGGCGMATKLLAAYLDSCRLRHVYSAAAVLHVYNHTADISPFSPTFGLSDGGNTPL